MPGFDLKFILKNKHYIINEDNPKKEDDLENEGNLKNQPQKWIKKVTMK